MSKALLKFGDCRKLGFHFYSEIANVDGLPVENSPRSRRLAVCRDAVCWCKNPIGSYGYVVIAIDTNDQSVGCIAQPRGAPCDSIKDRLKIRWRTGDDAQDLARCRLLLQSLSKFLRLRVEAFLQGRIRRGGW